MEVDVSKPANLKKMSNDDICIWTDPETNVQYIIYSHNKHVGIGGITPRLNQDGSLYIER